MGYYVEVVDSNWVIPKKNLDDAYKSMCDLNWRNDLKSGGRYPADESLDDSQPRPDKWFSWMEWNYHETCKDAKEVLDHVGFDTFYTDKGDLAIVYYDNKTGAEELFLATIAPYSEDGSCIVWRGEDGSVWRNIVRDGIMIYENGQLTFKEIK